MITSKDCFAKYGDPSANERRFMIVWDVPTALEHGAIPKRIYCNKDLIPLLEKAFKNVNDRGISIQIKTWDGCFNIRRKRGAASMSLHSWGLAIDINAAWNGFGKKPTMSPELVKCFTDAGFNWGGNWKRQDGMHMEIAKLP
jgi:hypothetical protein